MRVKVVALAHLGRLDEARAELGRLRRTTPNRRSPRFFAGVVTFHPSFSNSTSWVCASSACRRTEPSCSHDPGGTHPYRSHPAAQIATSRTTVYGAPCPVPHISTTVGLPRRQPPVDGCARDRASCPFADLAAEPKIGIRPLVAIPLILVRLPDQDERVRPRLRTPPDNQHAGLSSPFPGDLATPVCGLDQMLSDPGRAKSREARSRPGRHRRQKRPPAKFGRPPACRNGAPVCATPW
jgi:hypothetical protein